MVRSSAGPPSATVSAGADSLQTAAGVGAERGIAWRLAFFYAALSSAFGVIVPFWPTWLAARGLDATQIGLLLSLGYWIKLAGNPILASLADRHGDVRRILIALAFANF